MQPDFYGPIQVLFRLQFTLLEKECQKHSNRYDKSIYIHLINSTLIEMLVQVAKSVFVRFCHASL